MMPIVHTWGEGIMMAAAILAGILLFERRLAKVEAKVELILKRMQFGDDV